MKNIIYTSILWAILCLCLCAKKTDIPGRYIDTKSQEFHDNFVDIRKVANIIDTENGTMIILKNGEGYYWER